MSVCLDCQKSPRRLCSLHAATDNLTESEDPLMLLIEAQEALDAVGRKGHLPCGVLAGRIARFLARQRVPT